MKFSTSLAMREMKIKTMLHKTEWLISKTPIIIYAGEDAVKGKHLSIAGGNENM